MNSIVSTTRQASGVTATGGGAVTAGMKASESAGFIEWVDQNAVFVGLTISAIGLIVHIISVIIDIRIKKKNAAK